MQIGICDDEEAVRELLEEKVKSMYPGEPVLQYESGEELLARKELPDILFLDIQMPGTDGMETASRLRERDYQGILIFVTGTGDYVFQAFDVGAFHYLVKPFSEEKFAEVFQKAVKQYRDRKKPQTSKALEEIHYLLIKAGGSHIRVKEEDIVYAEVFNRKIILHTIEEDIEYYGKMKELEKELGEHFYRSHRAYLVNFSYIQRYDAEKIYLERGQALVAKQNYPEFVKRYLRFIQGVDE